MNRLLAGLGVALALGIGVSASVLADQGASTDKPKWHEGRGGFRELNLTDDQKSQMKALHEHGPRLFRGSASRDQSARRLPSPPTRGHFSSTSATGGGNENGGRSRFSLRQPPVTMSAFDS